MAGFVQIVEFQTARIDELRKLSDEMNPQSGSPLLRRTVTADRDRPGHYFTIIEFDSYESAMEASTSPQVSEFAARMAVLCDSPPTFRNLDVIDAFDSESSGPSKTAVVAGTAAAAAGVAVAAAAVKSKAGKESDDQDVAEVGYTEVSPVAVTGPVASTTIDESATPVGYTSETDDYRGDQGRTL